VWNAGTIQVGAIQAGDVRHLVGTGSLVNEGLLQVAPDAELVADGPVDQIAGSTLVDGTLVAPAFFLHGGRLGGGGAIEAILDADGGVVAPGSSAGTIGIDELELHSATTTEIEVLEGEADLVDVAGEAALAGTLAVDARAVPEDLVVLSTAIELGITGEFADVRGVPDSWVQVSPAAVQLDAVAPFPDVPLSHPFLLDIAWAVGDDVTEGYLDGLFRPTTTVSRQVALTWLWRTEGEPDPPTEAPTFTDVPADHPFADPIAWAAATGITTGYPDGTFGPTTPLTRQTGASLLWRATRA